MARDTKRGIERRVAVGGRQSAPEQYRISTSGAEAQSYSAVSNITAGVLGRLSQAANAQVQQRQVQQNRDDTVKGAEQRTKESIDGTAVQSEESLSDLTPAFRRGYYVTEASNKVNEAKRGLINRVAQMDVGDDPQEAIQETLSGLMGQKEFQDPQVMARLQPALDQLRQQALDVHAKSETAELLERQTENIGTMLRNSALDGSLLAPGGIDRAAQALDTEEFAYVSRNEFYNAASDQIENVLASGEGNVGKLTEFLKNTKDDGGVPLWDRKTATGQSWSDSFAQAARSGTAIQAKALEEKQADIQASFESDFQKQAGNGRLSDAKINDTAGKLGLDGKDRLQFVRHWIDQNQTGIRRLESEAKEAARHKEVIATLNAGNGLTLTTARLQKSATAEWGKAVTSGDKQAQANVIARYTKFGVVIPELKDMIGRTTSSNLSQNYAAYKAIADVDPITASRYLSDDNAVMFQEFHENRTTFGMNEQEALQQIARPEMKAVRSDVSARVGKAAVAYFKENEEMPDGSPMPPWLRDRVQKEATNLSMRSPQADPKAALRVAFSRVQSDMANVNGRWVPRGGMRTGAEAGVTEFVRRALKDAVSMEAITPDLADGAFAAPTAEDPNVYMVLDRDGIPVSSKEGRFIVFDPNETAAGVQQWKRDEAEQGARWAEKNKPKFTVLGVDPAQAAASRTSKGDPSLPPSVTKLGEKAPSGPARPKPTDMIDYLSTFKH